MAYNIYDTSAIMAQQTPVMMQGVGTSAPATTGFDWGGMAGVATSLIGGLSGAFTADQVGANNEAYEYYQAEVAKINRDIKQDQQKDILVQGQIQLAEHTRQVGEAIATNIAKQGSSGFQVSEDAVTAIQRMGDRQGVEIQKNIENAYLEVGYQALGLEMSSAGHEMAARNEKQSARTTALTRGTTALGNAATKLGAFMNKKDV